SHLRSLGAAPDTPVALAAERGVDMVIGVLAILKAGGVCLPLDWTHPPERLRLILEDAAPPILLTHPDVLPPLPAPAAAVVCLDDWRVVEGADPPDPSSGVGPDRLIYVLYTSGSTGTPKGVAMRHGAIANLVAWQLDHWTARREATTAQFAPLTFD